MRSGFHNLIHLFRDVLMETILLLGMPFRRLQSDKTDIVVSMTSYPARIRGAWVALESLFRQDYRAFTLVLVLTEGQFPGRKLPPMIRLLQWKGLRLLWVDEDNKSFDHLWPAYKEFPRSKIISVDDDKVFPRHLVKTLVEVSDDKPGVIVGARGWEMRLDGSKFGFGLGWSRADYATPSRRLFMPPGNGSLYPPNSLPELTGDTVLMRKICPRADDVWYWAMARIAGTESICLGMPAHRSARTQKYTPALAQEDPGPQEFEAVIEKFGLTRELLSELGST